MPLASLAPQGRAAGLAARALGRLGKVGRDIIRMARGRHEENPTPKPQSEKPNIFERPKGVPKEWIQSPSRNQKGFRYRDPKNIHNEVRVQKGDPKVSNTSQQQDYVKWKRNGQWLDKNGKPVSGNSQEAHIPIENFKFDLRLFK